VLRPIVLIVRQKAFYVVVYHWQRVRVVVRRLGSEPRDSRWLSKFLVTSK